MPHCIVHPVRPVYATRSAILEGASKVAQSPSVTLLPPSFLFYILYVKSGNLCHCFTVSTPAISMKCRSSHALPILIYTLDALRYGHLTQKLWPLSKFPKCVQRQCAQKALVSEKLKISDVNLPSHSEAACCKDCGAEGVAHCSPAQDGEGGLPGSH